MKDTPFGRVTRSVRWLRLALFGAVPILIMLAVGLYWGVQRIVAEQEEKLRLHFSLTMGYLNQHERFLHGIREQNARLTPLVFGPQATLHREPLQGRSGFWLMQGQDRSVHLPFSLVCSGTDCPAGPTGALGIGQYLSNAYTRFWSTASMPPGEAFFLDRNSSLAISVPSVATRAGFEPLDQRRFIAVLDRVRTHLAEHGVHEDEDLRDARVRWLRSPELPDAMVALLPAPAPPDVWTGVKLAPPDVYAASLLHFRRIGVFEYFLGKRVYDDHWLVRKGAIVLAGEGDPPHVTHAGLSYTAKGLVFRFDGPERQWEAYYRIGYVGFFRDNLWLPVGAGVLLILGIGSAVGFSRWYNRRVLAPALSAQREIVESEQFNRTLVDTAPVALCLLTADGGDVVFGNSLALDWLGTGRRDDESPLANLRRQIAGVRAPGVIDRLAAADGRVLHVAYAPTRYQQRDVVLCAFTDISVHAEIERTLAQAKRDADRASAAKSTFLSTMSHEIRTPLYGVLGTLELLELTPLDEAQRRHLITIKSSSAILLQLISDILDTTRVETGQMVLESETFSPRHLVEDAVAAYAAMAWQKQLLLFACIDPALPAMLRGDPGRIRQILNNLVSNAIKFTDAGHVVVRLHATGEEGDRARVRLEVADTGVGIDPAHRARLFEPFYQIDADEHEFRGAGLGLSICMQLANLMGSRIDLISEPGVGSRFSLELALERDAAAVAPPAPPLSGKRVQVRSAHPELTDNLCDWLRRWGADARAADIPPRASDPDELLVDVLLADSAPPAGWNGRHVVAGSVPTSSLSAAVADGHRLDSIAAAILAGPGEGTVSMGGPAAPSLPEPLRMNVLIAEDNPINRATLAHQLALLGCTVAVAADGVEALAIWRGGDAFDAVLTDANMPHLDGYGLARAIRAEDPAVPIIGVTANAMREEERKCREAGMTSWLVKPIGLRALHRHLRGETVQAPASRNGDDSVSDDAALPSQFNGLFNDAMRADIARVRESLAADQPRELLATLHRMRGALAMLQMNALIARFEQLEDRIRTEGADADARREVESAMGALEAELVRLG